MTLGDKLRSIRRDSGLTQHAFGGQGFVSVPAWIKLENGQRSPSEGLIDKLVNWLVKDKYIRSSVAKSFKEELPTLKYMGSPSPYLRELAHRYAAGLERTQGQRGW